MNRFRPLSYLRQGSCDPPPVDLLRLRESPLARVLLALYSAALLVCSLPQPDSGWLGWVALVPLIIACHGLPPKQAAGLGLISGIVASFGMYGWLFEVPSFDMRHAVVLALYVSVYPTAWCAATAWLTGRQIPLLLTAPALWVALDYLRAHAGVLTLPWGTPRATQHLDLAILQIASLAGEQGVTFLVALGNAALATVILQRERQAAAIAGIILALAHVWGIFVLYSAPQGATMAVTTIQPNIQIAERKTDEGRRAFNSAFLVRPGEPLTQPYRKRVPVPFAEYLLHPDVIPRPEWLAPRVSEMTPGQNAQLFNMATDLSIGTLICWGNPFAPFARESVHAGAQMLVQLTNDVWFGRTAAAEAA